MSSVPWTWLPFTSLILPFTPGNKLVNRINSAGKMKQLKAEENTFYRCFFFSFHLGSRFLGNHNELQFTVYTGSMNIIIIQHITCSVIFHLHGLLYVDIIDKSNHEVVLFLGSTLLRFEVSGPWRSNF